MTLRKLHRIVGLCMAPFFLLTATTGAILLWRNADLYSIDAKKTMLRLHNWEGLHGIGIHYLGILLAVGLVTMVVTGVTLAVQMRIRRRRGH